MLRKTNLEGPGSITNIDEVARLTSNGIYQVVALTRESPLDRRVTTGTSNGGVSGQMGAYTLHLSVEQGNIPDVELA